MAGLQKTVVLKAWRGSYGFLLTGSAPVTITSVDADGPAKACGLCHGDVVLAINGKAVSSSSQAQMVSYLRKKAGKRLTLIVQPMTMQQVNAYRRRLRDGKIGQQQSQRQLEAGRHTRQPHPAHVQRLAESQQGGKLAKKEARRRQKAASQGQFAKKALLAMRLMDQEDAAPKRQSDLIGGVPVPGPVTTSTPTRPPREDYTSFSGNASTVSGAPPSYSNEQFTTGHAAAAAVAVDQAAVDAVPLRKKSPAASRNSFHERRLSLAPAEVKRKSVLVKSGKRRFEEWLSATAAVTELRGLPRKLKKGEQTKLDNARQLLAAAEVANGDNPLRLTVSGGTGRASVINGIYNRTCVLDGRPVYMSKKKVPGGYGKGTGKNMLLYFHQLNDAWVLNIELGTNDVIAFAADVARHPEKIVAVWNVVSDAGVYVEEPVVTVTQGGLTKQVSFNSRLDATKTIPHRLDAHRVSVTELFSDATSTPAEAVAGAEALSDIQGASSQEGTRVVGAAVSHGAAGAGAGVGAPEWSAGDACRVAYHEDGEFYAAEVVSIDSRTGTCVVTFVDYGENQTQAISELFPPAEEGEGGTGQDDGAWTADGPAGDDSGWSQDGSFVGDIVVGSTQF